MSSPPFAFLASSSVLNKSPAGIVAIVPSLRTTVAFPSSSYLIALTFSSPPFNFFSFSVTSACAAGSVASPTFLSAGLRTPALPESGFAASAKVRTNSLAVNPAVFPSGVETVTVPLSSIVTTALGFTSRTAFLMFSLSASVKLSGFATITLSVGRLMLLPPPAVSKAFTSFVKSSCFNGSATVFPGKVTKALPLGFTSTFVPGGFTASIAFLSSACSLSSKAVGFLAITLFAGKRAELMALIAASADFLALSTSAFFLAPSIASSEAFLTASTSS